MQHWEETDEAKPSDPPSFIIHENDKQIVRDHIVEAVIAASNPIRSVLDDASMTWYWRHRGSVEGQRLLVDDEDRMRPGYWLHGYQFSGNVGEFCKGQGIGTKSGKSK